MKLSIREYQMKWNATCNSSSKTRPAMLVAGICIFLHRRLPVGLIERYAKEGEREPFSCLMMLICAFTSSSLDDFYSFFFLSLSSSSLHTLSPLSFWVEQVNQKPYQKATAGAERWRHPVPKLFSLAPASSRMARKHKQNKKNSPPPTENNNNF